MRRTKRSKPRQPACLISISMRTLDDCCGRRAGNGVARIFNPQSVQTIQDVPRLETCDTVPQLREKSALRSAAPPAYADFIVQRPLPTRRHRIRIPIIFLGPLQQEEEEPVQIQVGPIKVSAETFTNRHC